MHEVYVRPTTMRNKFKTNLLICTVRFISLNRWSRLFCFYFIFSSFGTVSRKCFSRFHFPSSLSFSGEWVTLVSMNESIKIKFLFLLFENGLQQSSRFISTGCIAVHLLLLLRIRRGLPHDDDNEKKPGSHQS